MKRANERVIVGLRRRSRAGTTGEYDQAVVELSERASVLGGRLVSWQWDSLAYDFDPDAWEDALEFALALLGERWFGVGVSCGEVVSVVARGARTACCRGPALGVARSLASRAEPGEVWVTRQVLASHPYSLLTDGRYRWRRGSRVCAALRVDPARPRPSVSAEDLSRIEPAPWIGPPPEQVLKLDPGAVTVLRASPGGGATRFVRELEAVFTHLKFSGGPAGEPLGALRRALLREVGIAKAFDSPSPLEPAFQRLRAGAGLVAADARHLIEHWAESCSRTPLLLIEAPERIDQDSLRAIVEAEAGAAVVVVGGAGRLGEPLSLLPLAGEFALGPLAAPDAERVLQGMTGNMLSEPLRRRWARRGAHVPLALAESLLDAVEANELVWENRALVARGRVAGRGGGQSASYFVARRAARLSHDERHFLETLAVLGGEAEVSELTMLAEHGAFRGSLTSLTRTLNTRRWVRRSGERLVALASQTVRCFLVESLSEERSAALHLAAVNMFEASSRPLAAGSAAVHALLAGDGERAEALSHRMATLCRVNQRPEAALSFATLSETLQLEALESRSLHGGWATRDVATAPPEETLSRPGGLPAAHAVAASQHQRLASAVEPAPPGRPAAETDARRRRSPERDPPAPDRLVEVLADLANRAGVESDACRRALLEALWSARARRPRQALLSALSALAEARRRGDLRGERACSLLLSALSRHSGAEPAAKRWGQVCSASSQP